MTNTTDLPDDASLAIDETLNTWDIDTSGDTKATQISDDTYEASVRITGRVLLDDLLDDQGPLLYMKDDIEVSLKGFENDRLLLEITRH